MTALPDYQDKFPDSPRFHEDEIPTIDDGMLHAESVDFEARMSPWPAVSLVLIVACVIAFGFQAAGGGLDDLDTLVSQGALERDRVEQGEVWRMLSATFMHGSIDHLLGNLLILYVLGMACEHGFGRPQFLVLYVAAGLTGSLLSLLGGRPSVGASGAIFGLAGALIVLFWRFKGRLHVRDARIGLVLGVWAMYQLGLGLINPAVDNFAHLGGLLGGIAMGLVLRPAVLDGRREVAAHPLTRVGFVLAILALGTTAAYFVPRLMG